MKSDFEEKRNNRQQRFEELAEKAKNESQSAYNRSNSYVAGIPMGQPILVGHHSEKRHRRAIDNCHNAMRKSIELDKKAEYYAERAKSAAQNNAIFSDDPNAIEKLADKIERLEKQQELMRSANKLIRKNDVEGLLNLGFSEGVVNKLFQPDFCGRIGFADYRLTNNSANIRRLKQRLEQEQKKAELETTETEINGVKIVENVEDNRTQLFFDGKPSDEIRTELKRNGFRWSPYNGCWQRHLSNGANWTARKIAESYK